MIRLPMPLYILTLLSAGLIGYALRSTLSFWTQGRYLNGMTSPWGGMLSIACVLVVIFSVSFFGWSEAQRKDNT
jgi:hypothetical protein